QCMIDAEAEIVLPFFDHVLDDSEQIAGADIPAAEAGGAMIDLPHAQDSFGPALTGDGIPEDGLDLAREMFVRRRERVAHSFEHRERHAMSQSFDDLPRWERTKAANRQAAALDSLVLAKVIDGSLGSLHVAAHADDDVLGVFAAVRHDEVVS